MKKNKKILIIIQRSNGDVFLSASLINNLYKFYQSPEIDLLVNDDTFPIASLLSNINFIHTFSYAKKKVNQFKQEKNLLMALFKKYDLSINLTASDRSVIYALLAGRKSISAVEKDNRKSWWKKIFLKHYYYFEPEKHILENNLESLNLLNINHEMVQDAPKLSDLTYKIAKSRLKKMRINSFLIFHPSAQYNYKIYPKELRDKLLNYLNDLGLPILITGGNNRIDLEIKNQLPILSNVFDLIGETTLEEYFALSELSLAYVGMDTLNMHIAAAQNKRIFAIFGPTNLSMWSPWSNELKKSVTKDAPIQTYGNITLFQANMPCVACGNAGCDNQHGISECLYHISSKVVSQEVKNWYQNVGL